MMDEKNKNFLGRIKITKEEIPEFLNRLLEVQLDMIERAVEKSNLKDAIELIDYIKAKK
jgi:hypothetical protein